MRCRSSGSARRSGSPALSALHNRAAGSDWVHAELGGRAHGAARSGQGGLILPAWRLVWAVPIVSSGVSVASPRGTAHAARIYPIASQITIRRGGCPESRGTSTAARSSSGCVCLAIMTCGTHGVVRFGEPQAAAAGGGAEELVAFGVAFVGLQQVVVDVLHAHVGAGPVQPDRLRLLR
jgi:hypothetical protein